MIGYEDFAVRIVEQLGIDCAGPVNPYAELYEELGLDSLQVFQLLVRVETLAGADLPPLDLPEIYTMQDAHDYYKLSSRGCVAFVNALSDIVRPDETVGDQTIAAGFVPPGEAMVGTVGIVHQGGVGRVKPGGPARRVVAFIADSADAGGLEPK